MNEARFKAVFNGLSSIAQKVYEAIPAESYYSIKRIHSEVFRLGKNVDQTMLAGVLNTLVKAGLLLEIDQGMFSKTKITKKVLSKAQEIEYADTKPVPKQDNKKDIAVPAKENKPNPFDGLREVTLKFMDLAKSINSMAAELDANLAKVEEAIDANKADMEKFKQFQALLKSMG